jgi:hypothetical protein
MPIPSRCDWALTAFISPQPLQVERSPAAGGVPCFGIQPNPFSTHTCITYRLAGPAPVSLVLYDPSGRAVRTLLSRKENGAGLHQTVWDARDENGRRLASGIYFVALEIGKQRIVHRLVVRE